MSKKRIDITSSTYSFIRRNYIVTLILAAALGLRLWGVGYGLPFIFHPDENRQILDSLGMAERMSVLPQEYSYPALHKYLLLLVNGAYFAAGRLFGVFKGPSDFALKFLEGESSVFLLSRLLSVGFGTALCALLYVMGAKLFSRNAGFIALALSSGMFHLIQHSQWAIADIVLAFFTAAALYFIMLSVSEPGPMNTALSFFLAGLAVSTKPQGIFLVFPLLLSRYYIFKDSGFRLKDNRHLSDLTVAFAAFVPAALIGNLAWVFDFGAVYTKFKMLSQVAHLGISSKEPFTPGFVSLLKWFAYELVRQEGPLGAVLLAGAVYAALKHTRKDMLFLLYIGVFMFAVRNWAIRYLHLFVAVFPVLCLFAARMADDFFSRTRLNSWVCALTVAAVILPSTSFSIEASITKDDLDTRAEARQWVEANIPAGTAIAVDWYEFSIPLFSSTPVYLRNPKATDYFQRNVDGRVKRGYEDFLKGKTVYRMLPVVYSTEKPNWPAEMPESAREKAARNEVYRELYSVFNFHTVEELKKEGARYIILTSYGYTNFLLDSDPNKNEAAVFNYLFREDLLSFNKQANSYDGTTPFGLLYFLNKRARDFYTPLLNGKKAMLVKAFSPSHLRPGPFIKIYEI